MWQEDNIVNFHTHKIPNHDCELNLDEEVVWGYIDQGFFVDLRRKFRCFCMISPTNPDSKRFLRSSTNIYKEKRRHLRYYYHMIHPFSDFRDYWEMVMLVTFSLLFILIPLDVIDNRPSRWTVYLPLPLFLICWVDIILAFWTGYYDEVRHVVIMKPKLIAKKYLSGMFFIDAVSSVPYDVLLTWFSSPDGEEFLIKIILFFKVFRIRTYFIYIDKLHTRLNLRGFKLNIIRFVIGYIIALLWTTSAFLSLFYVVSVVSGDEATLNKSNVVKDTSPIFFVVQCLRDAILIICLVGFQLEKLETAPISTLICYILCVIFGTVFRIVILAFMVQMYHTFIYSQEKHDRLIQQMQTFMKFKSLSSKLKERIMCYMKFKYQKHMFKESEIINSLCASLRDEISVHNCKEMIERVDFFKDLPPNVMLNLISKLRSEIYLTDDLIVEAGVPGRAMYFVYLGTVAVYTKKGKEICHLDEGSHFGEIALVINEPRVASVIAITECELFRLSRRDFFEAIDPFPGLKRGIIASALARYEKTMRVAEEEEEFIRSTSLVKPDVASTSQNDDGDKK